MYIYYIIYDDKNMFAGNYPHPSQLESGAKNFFSKDDPRSVLSLSKLGTVTFIFIYLYIYIYK